MTTIPLPFKTPPLRANDRRSWPAQHRAFQAALEQARWAVRAARPQPATGPVHITLHYTPKTARRQDADGIFATLKPLLDALVAEHVLEDDSSLYVPRTTCWIHPPGEAALWLEVGAA